MHQKLKHELTFTIDQNVKQAVSQGHHVTSDLRADDGPKFICTSSKLAQAQPHGPGYDLLHEVTCKSS